MLKRLLQGGLTFGKYLYSWCIASVSVMNQRMQALIGKCSGKRKRSTKIKKTDVPKKNSKMKALGSDDKRQEHWNALLRALRLDPHYAQRLAREHEHWSEQERFVALKYQKKPLDAILIRKNEVLWSWCKRHAHPQALRAFVDQKAPMLAQYARGIFEKDFLDTTSQNTHEQGSWIQWVRKQGYWSEQLDEQRQDALLSSALEHKNEPLLQEHMQAFGINVLDQERLEGILGALGERKERALFEGMDQEHVQLLEVLVGQGGSFLDLLERLPEGALRRLIVLLVRALQQQHEEQVLKALHEQLKNAKTKVMFEKAIALSASTCNRSALLSQWFTKTGGAHQWNENVWLLEQKNKEHQLRTLKKVEQRLNLLEIAKISGAQNVEKILEKVGVRARQEVIDALVSKDKEIKTIKSVQKDRQL